MSGHAQVGMLIGVGLILQTVIHLLFATKVEMWAVACVISVGGTLVICALMGEPS